MEHKHKENDMIIKGHKLIDTVIHVFAWKIREQILQSIVLQVVDMYSCNS